MFTVDNDNFPEYDEDNLYNTNPDFDFGEFKDLREKKKLMGSNATLFSFRFNVPAVYVFKMSSAPQKKLVRELLTYY